MAGDPHFFFLSMLHPHRLKVCRLRPSGSTVITQTHQDPGGGPSCILGEPPPPPLSPMPLPQTHQPSFQALLQPNWQSEVCGSLTK